MKFKKNTIVVATRQEATGCGIIYIRKNSILKLAMDIDEGDWYASTYRNQREERKGDTHSIDIDKLREATPEEVNCWKNEVYYVPETKKEGKVA